MIINFDQLFGYPLSLSPPAKPMLDAPIRACLSLLLLSLFFFDEIKVAGERIINIIVVDRYILNY